jgi:curved DNA-binding protein CbpA
MSEDEARAELGLLVDADAAAIKRAYLRAVRAHPPERDPEGFARVREAFELLSAPTPVLPFELAVRPQPAASARPAPAPPVAAETAAQPSLAAEVTAPAATTSGPKPTRRQELAAMTTSFVAACRGDAQVMGPYTAAGCDLAVELFDFAMAEEGRAVVAAIDERIARDGARARDLDPGTASKLVLVHELSALSTRLNDDVATAFAYGIKTQNYTVARRQLAAVEEERGSVAIHLARTHAPTLLRAAAQTLATHDFRSPARRYFTPGRIVWMLFMATLIMRRCHH